uniref:Uncharacterized protein n=1 Tax=viral metagenome TaxID=1070528 RepID=A0A6M3LFP6_9ZZZZ
MTYDMPPDIPADKEDYERWEKDERSRQECQRLTTAVDHFAESMKRKLHQKAASGYRGWDDPSCLVNIKVMLLKHAADVYAGKDSQSVDVANLAMMIWQQFVVSLCWWSVENKEANVPITSDPMELEAAIDELKLMREECSEQEANAITLVLGHVTDERILAARELSEIAQDELAKTRHALDMSVHRQNEYAAMLNKIDGGKRQVFSDMRDWMFAVLGGPKE